MSGLYTSSPTAYNYTLSQFLLFQIITKGCKNDRRRLYSALPCLLYTICKKKDCKFNNNNNNNHNNKNKIHTKEKGKKQVKKKAFKIKNVGLTKKKKD